MIDPCLGCNRASSTEDKWGNAWCWVCYQGDSFPEPGSEMDLVVVPRCYNCQCELTPSLDCVWSDEDNSDYCFRCRRDPNRALGPF